MSELTLLAVAVSSLLVGEAPPSATATDRAIPCSEVQPTPCPSGDCLPRTPSRSLKAPVPVSRVAPEYPRHLQATEGVVVLEVVVSEKGRVESACVSKSLSPQLDLEATRAIKRWRFQPARIAAKPVKVTTTVEVPFRKNRP